MRFRPHSRRLLAALATLGATLAVASTACGSSQPAPPTPDPFADVAQRSNAAYQSGLDAYSRGAYREALNDFEQARLMAPSDTRQIDSMIDQTRAAMAPTPTPQPPTPTSGPATPTSASGTPTSAPGTPTSGLPSPSPSVAATASSSSTPTAMWTSSTAATTDVASPETTAPPAKAAPAAGMVASRAFPPVPMPSPTPARPQPAPVRAQAAPALPRADVAPLPPTPAPQPSLPSPTPVPTPAESYATPLGGVPTGLDVDAQHGRMYLADASGVIWMTDTTAGQQSTIQLQGDTPTDLAVDPSTGNLYVGSSHCQCILTLDPNGQTLGSIPLGAAPEEVRIDPSVGTLYVSLPTQQGIAEVSLRSGQPVGIIPGLPQVSALAIDTNAHTLYVTQLTGELTAIDTGTGHVTGRWSVSTPGLSGVATADGLAYTINAASHALGVFDPANQTVVTYQLSDEPAAVSASDGAGAVYVLLAAGSSEASPIVRIDPADGAEVGRVLLVAPNSSDEGHVPPARLVLDSASDSLYATLPASNAVAMVASGEFPAQAREIPQALQ